MEGRGGAAGEARLPGAGHSDVRSERRNFISIPDIWEKCENDERCVSEHRKEDNLSDGGAISY